jgi:hypothetical protein
VNTDADHMEFAIGIQDQGSATENETVVLTAALALAEELEAAARLRLGAATRR